MQIGRYDHRLFTELAVVELLTERNCRHDSLIAVVHGTDGDLDNEKEFVLCNISMVVS